MKKFFDSQANIWLIHIFSVGVLLTGIWANRFPVGNAFYGDPFHHGEFVASLPSLLAGNIRFLTIHGALDWLPAFFSERIFGADRHFLPTMLTYVSLDVFSGMLLYFLVASLTSGDNDYRAIILLISAVLATGLVGIREIFLIPSIWVYFLCEQSSSQWKRNLLEITLGLLFAANLLWSFDRGVAGIVSIGLACLFLAVSEKRYFLTMSFFVISLFVVTWIGAFSLSFYIENFRFLLATSSQWSYGYTKFLPVLLTVLVAIINGWALYYLTKQCKQAWQKGQIDYKEIASSIALTSLTVLMLKIGTNRADTHVLMALWMPVLSFLYLYKTNAVTLSVSANATIMIAIIWLALRSHNYWLMWGVIIPVIYTIETRFTRFTRYLKSLKMPIVACAIATLLIIINIHKISTNYSHDGYVWMSHIFAPPTNRSLVEESIQWVSAEMSTAGSPCVFDLSNNGVINGVTGLPACTKYTYPVYATQRYEADMIQELNERNPPVIVFSSTFWSFAIDGKSMHERFPVLKDYLIKTYLFEKCNFGYCLRYLNQPV